MVILEHVQAVTIGVVTYGSVKGVWGSKMASVVPSRAIASLSISPVDFVMSAIFVVRAIAAFVSVCAVRTLRRFRVVVVFEVILVVR